MPGNILIADDDSAMLKLYARIFASADYFITLAPSISNQKQDPMPAPGRDR